MAKKGCDCNMPRKSNKTAHVLNLLANGNDSEDVENSEDNEVSENTVTDNLPTSNSIEDFLDPSTNSKQAVIEFESSSNDPLSNLIKEELEKVAYSEFNLTPEESEEASHSKLEETTPKINSSILDLTNENQKDTLIVENQDITSVNQNQETFVSDLVPILPDENKADLNLPLNNDIEIKENYFFCHNVMEEIVKDNLDKALSMMNVCTCEKCRKDVMAITLNNLTPKYIVTNTGRLITRLNSYENQFSTTVTTQLIKACMIVNDFPKHEA